MRKAEHVLFKCVVVGVCAGVEGGTLLFEGNMASFESCSHTDLRPMPFSTQKERKTIGAHTADEAVVQCSYLIFLS